jgi:iron complex transport system permease protein
VKAVLGGRVDTAAAGAASVRTVGAARSGRQRRTVMVLCGLALATAGLFVVSMMVGSYLVPAVDVVRSVLHLPTDPGIDFIVRELRLPRAVAAVAVGMALGVAGVVFQRLLANPLAAPDIIGVSSGASLAAVAGIVLFQLEGYGIPAVSVLGALAGGAAIYLLAWRDGVSGYRLILVGVGVSEFMLSIVAYLVARADISDAREAMRWLVGSVGQSSPGELRVLLVGLLVLVPAALLLGRPLRTLELGDESARSLGVRIEPTRLALIAVSILLVALATAVAGPVAFVGLVAGPIAGRLLGATAGGVASSALVGACVVLIADLLTQHLLPAELPTGVVTGAVGAPYLIWLLATMSREGRGG